MNDTIDPRVVAHLVGYTAIVWTLATASWASMWSWPALLAITLVTLYVSGRYAFNRVLTLAEKQVEIAETNPTTTDTPGAGDD